MVVAGGGHLALNLKTPEVNVPISSADQLIRKTIKALWKERDRITDQIAALSKLTPSVMARPKGRRLSLVKGVRKRKK